MMKRIGITSRLAVTFAILWTVAGCAPTAKTDNSTTSGEGSSAAVAGSASGSSSFSLAWSEYPSWSVFGVAEQIGLLNGATGKRGTMEEKWGVDVELKSLDYDSCLVAYGASTTDAVCITNMDVLAPAGGRNSVAILPTSTSAGADACIVVGIDSVDDLKGKTSFGLEKSVSQYMFERVLENMGKDPSDFPFKQMDPMNASTAMKQGQANIDSIVVWNPFVMQTVREQPKSKVLFDSTQIPEEIVDMVVVGEDVLKRPGGEAFAACIADTFYEISRLIENPETRADTLTKLGQNFSGLSPEDMETIVKQTKFYKTAAEGMELFGRADFQNTIMPKVMDFCASHDIAAKPTVSYGDGSSQLTFDPQFMQRTTEAPLAK